jgi:hypothetical protein
LKAEVIPSIINGEAIVAGPTMEMMIIAEIMIAIINE